MQLRKGHNYGVAWRNILTASFNGKGRSVDRHNIIIIDFNLSVIVIDYLAEKGKYSSHRHSQSAVL